ncbi:hypothetical protein BV911_05980 [Pseudoruegeria sp. SK021]|nr:hypothetical protein BV911_05980 [Pseudoruegeria sp. SK021]
MAFCSQLAVPAHAFGISGAYLAARQASFVSDYSAAVDYFVQALAMDPSNPVLMENAISSYVNLGQIDRSFPIAKRMLDGDFRSQVAEMVVLAEQIDTGDYSGILTEFEEGRTVGPLVDGLAKAWALMGDGQVSEALIAFDAVSEETGLQSYGLFHKALALASVGDFEGADEILSGRAAGPLQVSRRGVIAHVEILSQLDRSDAALDLIDQTFGATPVPVLEEMKAQLESGEPLAFDVATTPRQGMSEVFFSVAGALAGESAPGYALLYARVAQFLNPENIDAVLLSASLLEDLEQYDLATRAYESVPHDHPSFISAEIGRADALQAAGNTEGSIKVMQDLAAAHPDLLIVQVTLADSLRRDDRFEEAVPVYDSALDLIETPRPQHWVVLFSRGISLERVGRWAEAEADFRAALDLSPDQPQVLNYLGYSMVEKQENLDEALHMIEVAVEARPDDAYITDSLGWVLYRLGRYDEAVVQMERAAELMPVDPILNDHLGDVYWAVGRQMEAKFQWRRALSFGPEEVDAERIRRKLEVGLDVVLEEEGADPIAVSNEG